MTVFESEISPGLWNKAYTKAALDWSSAGLSTISAEQLTNYSAGSKLLEVGCGTGHEAFALHELGFEYLGIDFAEQAIKAVEPTLVSSVQFEVQDFFRFTPSRKFDVLYDKGFFHGLAGVRRRNRFIRKAAALLRPKGIWITVCGSADDLRNDRPHGAIYLRDLIAPAEIYFEVLDVRTGDYGLENSQSDFKAWYAAFRRR